MNNLADTARLADDELRIVRVFDAPVALVFELWASRDHMIEWLGPEEFSCTHLDHDFRPGGTWRACVVSDQYGESWMGGTFREIVKDRRIVTSFAWEDGRDQPGMDTLITVDFADQGGKTVQTFHQRPFISVAARDSHVGGWNSCFNRLAAHAARAGGAA